MQQSFPGLHGLTRIKQGMLWVQFFTPNLATALKGRNQGGYGLVNLSLGFENGGDTVWTTQVTTNEAGEAVGPAQCNPNAFAAGIEVYEQGGYGLVDARLLCSDGNSTPWLVSHFSGDKETIITVTKLRNGGAITRWIWYHQRPVIREINTLLFNNYKSLDKIDWI